jgi:hypothetical protein
LTLATALFCGSAEAQQLDGYWRLADSLFAHELELNHGMFRQRLWFHYKVENQDHLSEYSGTYAVDSSSLALSFANCASMDILIDSSRCAKSTKPCAGQSVKFEIIEFAPPYQTLKLRSGNQTNSFVRITAFTLDYGTCPFSNAVRARGKASFKTGDGSEWDEVLIDGRRWRTGKGSFPFAPIRFPALPGVFAPRRIP